MRVLVIGGGIAGLTIARELRKHGANDVVIIDKGMLGRESSFAAAGMLGPQAECDQDDAFFRLCSEARDFYPGFADIIREESGVDIELERSGTIYAAFDEKDEAKLAARYEWQLAAGLNVEKLSASETHTLEPLISKHSIASLYFADDWQVENRKLMSALAVIIKADGTIVIEKDGITALTSEKGSITGAVTTGGRVFEADAVILATGAWTSIIETNCETAKIPAIRPVRGQMVCYSSEEKLLKHVVYSSRGYLVPRLDGRLLSGATTESTGFLNETTEEGVAILKKNAVEIMPGLRNLEISDKWSGLRPCSDDELPIFGAVPGSRNLFIATGHYRNGILLAPLTAKFLVEAIVEGNSSPLLDEFSVERFGAAAVGN